MATLLQTTYSNGCILIHISQTRIPMGSISNLPALFKTIEDLINWHTHTDIHITHSAHKTQTSRLLWRHNGRDCVSNHQPHDCLLNRLFRHRSKKRGLVNSPLKWPVTRQFLPEDIAFSIHPTGNSRCNVLASRALNMSGYFDQSARSIESRCVVMVTIL